MLIFNPNSRFADGLVGFWPLGVYPDGRDMSLYGRHGTPFNNPVPSGYPPRMALDFNKSDDEVLLGTECLPLYSGDYTVMLMFNPSSLPSGSHNLIGAKDQYAHAFFVNQLGTSAIFYALASAASGASVTLTQGVWQHVLFSIEGQTVNAYLNGELVSTGTIGTNAPENKPVFVGGLTGWGDSIAGLVDDVRFYKRALPADEIAQLYAEIALGFYGDLLQEQGLVYGPDTPQIFNRIPIPLFQESNTMIYGVEQVLYYIAWNVEQNDYHAGDVANHTLFWNKDGTASTPSNTPTEVDATGQPGLYALVVTATEASCLSGRLQGTSSTDKVVLIFQDAGPIRLPNEDFNAPNGLPLTSHLNQFALETSVQSIITTGGTGPWTTAVLDLTGIALENTSQQILTDVGDILTTGGAGPWTTATLDLTGVALESTSQQILSDVGDINTMTDAEMQQFRYQVGIDGTSQMPATAIPNLSTFNAATDLTKANVVQVNGSTDILVSWARNIATIVAATVSDIQEAPTSTVIYTDLAQEDTDHFKNRAVIVYDGPVAKQASLITGYEYVNGEGKLTVAGFTRAPEPGNVLIIV
jgi:hypothetical protein